MVVTEQEVKNVSRSSTLFWDEAVEVLKHYGVEHPEALWDWYNISGSVTPHDIVLMLNANFKVEHCDWCGCEVYRGNPDNWEEYQGVRDDDLLPATINGREIALCHHCWNRLEMIGR